eukprot:15476747-Alexandrium_andersonii.AAC.1
MWWVCSERRRRCGAGGSGCIQGAVGRVRARAPLPFLPFPAGSPGMKRRLLCSGQYGSPPWSMQPFRRWVGPSSICGRRGWCGATPYCVPCAAAPIGGGTSGGWPR